MPIAGSVQKEEKDSQKVLKKKHSYLPIVVTQGSVRNR